MLNLIRDPEQCIRQLPEIMRPGPRCLSAFASGPCEQLTPPGGASGYRGRGEGAQRACDVGRCEQCITFQLFLSYGPDALETLRGVFQLLGFVPP